MFLAIDIGNTNTKLALFKGEKIFYSRRLVADKSQNANQCAKALKRIFEPLKVRALDIEAILVCSVVPELTFAFKKALFSLFKKKPLILGKSLIAPIKNLYRRPQQVGQDRLANAVAAVSKYGSPVIVVDFGTALTFDLVTAAGNYLGGIIVPGMEISLKALIRNTALLPDIALSKPGPPTSLCAGWAGPLLGRETASSMKSGLVYGYSFLVEGILQQLKKELSKKCSVVATGGEAPLMLRYCPSINKIDANLTLEGLRIILQRRKEAKRLKK